MRVFAGQCRDVGCSSRMPLDNAQVAHGCTLVTRLRSENHGAGVLHFDCSRNEATKPKVLSTVHRKTVMVSRGLKAELELYGCAHGTGH